MPWTSGSNAPGDRMYVGRPGGEIWTVDPTTGRRIEPTLQTDGGDPVFVSTSPDGSRVLVTSWNMEYTPDSILFDAETGERIRVGLVGIGVTALTARGEVVSASETQSIVRYDADTFERIGALPGASGGLDSVSVSADGRMLSTYSLDDTVSVYDLEGGIRLGDPIPVSGEWNYPRVRERTPECSAPMEQNSPSTSRPASPCGISDRHRMPMRPARWRAATSRATSGPPISATSVRIGRRAASARSEALD